MPVRGHSGELNAIRSVLASYRSTEVHVTEEQVTAAWAEYEEARERQKVKRADSGPWPVAVSDGLDITCSDCGELPQFDYRVDDDFWREHVPEKPARLSVVCLPCLDRRCGGVGLAAALREVQFVGTDLTVVLRPARRFVYGGSTDV